MDADAENQYVAPISTPFPKSPLVDLGSFRQTSSNSIGAGGPPTPASATAVAVAAAPVTATPSPAAGPTSTPASPAVPAPAPILGRKKILCFHRNINKIDELIKIILQLSTLTPLEQTTIRIRYIELLLTLNRRCTYYSLLFRILRIIVTVGSLLVPALHSVQYDDKYKTDMYWATWVISLAVTTSNGIFTLFKIDKKYYFLHTIKELLISEGWQYIALTGRYGTGGHLPLEGGNRTHSALFPYFCHYVEKIKLKQVEEEYYKGIESNQTQASAAASASSAASAQSNITAIQAANKLYQITPDKNIAQSEKNVEQSTKVQVNQFLNNMAHAQAQAQAQTQTQTQTQS